MKHILTLIFVLSFTFGFGQGSERWDIKTLNDSLSSKIDTIPIAVTIKELNGLFKPVGLKTTTPRFGSEFKTYQIIGKVLDFRKQADEDYHIIVQDLDDPLYTIIVEVIMPKYGNPEQYQTFKKVRDYTLARIRYGNLRGNIYCIKGVGFFDLIHNQKGKAINGFELHPVLEIKKICR